QAPKGMRDVLAPESARWQALVATFAEHARRAGYGLVLTPLIEHVEVFQRVGDSTDIVRKEMYDFDDKGGRRVAVRPEITAGLIRAYVEHRPALPWKAWTVGPNFRYEQPQAARYRQHHQLDAEIVGTADPDADVEIIALLDGFHRALGLQRRTLVLNSLGDSESRPAYAEALRSYLEAHAGDLSAQSRETLALNPLRVLDSKRPQDAEIIAAAPVTIDYLSPAATAHFEHVQAGLRDLGIAYEISPRLVRGLDYYTHTVFEFAGHLLGGAQNALGGGGRYDGLVEQLGGPPTPAVGFGAGIERILLACDAEGVLPGGHERVDAFVVVTTEGTDALVLTAELRTAGVSADRAFGGRSMKAQMKAADRSGAHVAVIVGADEAAAGEVTVRPLRGGDQQRVPRSDLVKHVKELIS
ncbi:MAG TPA: histidine--tRNA ligase, partial [Acidimicrobiales bacterium]